MTISRVVAHKNWKVRYSPCSLGFYPKRYARPFDQNLASLLIYFFYLHTYILQKNMVLFHLIVLLYMTIWPKIWVFIDLFLSCAHDDWNEIYGPFLFILSFVHDHLTKTQGPHWFISFICTRPFYKNEWSYLFLLGGIPLMSAKFLWLFHEKEMLKRGRICVKF